MKSIKPEQFFKLVAVNSGVVDLETVQRIYYGLVKTISKELKSAGIVNLPAWGKFSLKTYKARTTTDVNTGQKIMLPPQTMVKFSPDYKVRAYFYEFGKAGLYENIT